VGLYGKASQQYKTMSTNIISHNQSGGITAYKVGNPKENKNVFSKIINNPWLVTIIGGLVLAYFIYRIYGHI